MQRDQRQPGQPQDQRAARLDPGQRQVLATAGFSLGQVPLAAIEAGGGSLRCCVAEVF